MRRLLAILTAAALIGTAPLAARQTPQRPTFRSSVTLVAVDVTVLDDNGAPVRGLTADDFQIKLNGKVQPVRTLNFVEVAKRRADLVMTDVPATGRQVATNDAPVGERKVFVLAIDDMSFTPLSGKGVFAAAQRFLDRAPDDAYIGLATTTGTTTVNPTLDRAPVRAALKKIVGTFIDPRRPLTVGGPTVGIAEALEIVEYNSQAALDEMLARECAGQYNNDPSKSDVGVSRCATSAQSAARMIVSQTRAQTRAQVSALASIASSLKDAQALKQMIILSEGIGTTREMSSVLEPIGRAAAEAGVQLSLLMEDADGLDMSDQGRAGVTSATGVADADTGLSNRVRADYRMFRGAMQTLADISGGTFETVVGQADRAFDRAAVAGSAVYRLGVEAPADANVDKPITVSASVTRSKVTVHANRQAVLPGPTVTPSLDQEVKEAINEGQPFYAVPVRAAIARRRASAGQVELGIGLDVPGNTPGPLTMTFGLIDSAGALRTGSKTLPSPSPSGSYRLTFPMPVSPGDYHVRFAVTDAAGNIGSLDTKVSAQLTPLGPAGALLASDVLTWWTDTTGKAQFLALEEIPPGVASLGTGVELYPKPGALFPNDVTVTMSLTPRGGGAAVASQTVTPLIGADLMRAEAYFPMAGLAPGAYLLHASISAGGQALGEVTAVVKK